MSRSLINIVYINIILNILAVDLITSTWPRAMTGRGMIPHGGMINGQRKCAGMMMDGKLNLKKNMEKNKKRPIRPMMEKLLRLNAHGVKPNGLHS